MPRATRRWLVVAWAALSYSAWDGLPARAHAQRQVERTAAAEDPGRLALGPADGQRKAVSPSFAGGQQAGQPGLNPAFLASAVLPGAAQYLAGDTRWIAYAALEAWAWVSYLQERSSGRRLAQEYRDLAWLVARRVSVGERRDTVFEYYEAMAYYPSSGSFDSQPTIDGIQPERQLNTLNGDLWDLAQALHIAGGVPAAPGTPGYDDALAYYMEHAIGPGYAWAWGASNLEQQEFARLIAESDAGFRSATRHLGIIIANHVVSAVDALVTARLRQISGDSSLRFDSAPHRDGSAIRWEHTLRIGF